MTSDRGDDFVNGKDGGVKDCDSSEGAERNGNLGLVVSENEDRKDQNRKEGGDGEKEEKFVIFDSMEKEDVGVEDESVKEDDSFVEGVESNENEERISDLGMGNEMDISILEEKVVVQNYELEEDQNRDGYEEFVGGDSLLDSVDGVVETKGKVGLVNHETEPLYLDEEGQKVEVKNVESLGNEKSDEVESDQPIHHCFLLQENNKTGYSINDLVWGKVKSHPWCPGQIFDPKYASEMALKHQKNDCFLVAYFGDNTFAWVPESQLKPFQAYFLILEKQSSMVPFVNSVSVILEEVTRQVELGMACPCLRDETYNNLKYQKVENSGIQNGTFRAFVDGSVFLNAFRPRTILEYVRVLAQCHFGEFDRLELTIATAQLKVFYHWKSCPELPVFVYGGGLVENDAEISLANTKMSGKGKVSSSTIAASSVKSEKRPRGSRSKKHSSVDDDELNSMSKKKEEVASNTKSGKRPRGRARKNNIYEDGSEQKNQFEQEEEYVDKSGYKVKSKKERHGREVELDTVSPSKVGDRISRVASQLKNSEMLSQLFLLASDPTQGCGFLPTIISFFTKFKDSPSSGFSKVQEELVKSMGRKCGRKRKVVNSEDASSEMSEVDSMQDPYWSDIILQYSPDEEPVSKGQKRKRVSQQKKTKPNMISINFNLEPQDQEGTVMSSDNTCAETMQN